MFDFFDFDDDVIEQEFNDTISTLPWTEDEESFTTLLPWIEGEKSFTTLPWVEDKKLSNENIVSNNEFIREQQKMNKFIDCCCISDEEAYTILKMIGVDL